MTKKTTKKALVLSLFSLLLCFSMLLGTTFAWFTDSVTSAGNIIKSGTLDVTMEWAKGTDDPTNAAWTDASAGPIFKNDLWEPGYTEARHIKIANEGTLALKYSIVIEATGEVEDLADVIDVYFIDPAAQVADRTALANLEPVGTLTDVLANMADLTAATLLAGENDTVTIVLKMQETAGNEYQGKQIGDEFAIKLIATQMTAEKDSFDDQYDAGANWLGGIDTSWYDPTATELTISTPEQLAGLAAIVNGTATAPTTKLDTTATTTTLQDSFAGKTIKLASNIDLNNIGWSPIGADSSNSFKGIFDGQGYTVSNLRINAIEESYIGLFGYVKGGSVKNVNVNNVELSGYSYVGSVVGRVYTGSIDNCHVTGSVELVSEYAYAGGIVGGDYVNITNCSVLADGMGSIAINDKTGAGGICGWHTEGPYQMSNCHVKNLNITAYTNLGGITGFVHYQNTIDGCSVENVTLTKTRADGHPGIGMAAGGWSYNASNAITITNNTFKDITFNGTFVFVESADLLHGSEYSGKLTKNFVLDNNTTENITNNLVEVTKVGDGIVDNNGVKQIYNANGLLSLSGTKISGTYELVADIDLGGAEFKAMSAWYAAATFNGNGYTISNAKVVSGDNDNGMEQASLFFVSTNGSLTVSDLTIKDITVTTKNIDNGYAAAVVGYCEGALVLNNVDVVNADITGSKSSGMLVGHLTPAGSLTATDCDVDGSITISSFEAAGHYAGEYVGTIAGNTTLTNCTADVTLGGNIKNTNVGTIYGRRVSGTVVVNGATVVTSATELSAAVAAGVTNLYLADGEYDIANCNGKTLTISGSKNAVLKVMNEGEGGADYGFHSSTVTINGVTVDTTANTGSYKGYAYAKITYNDCAFVGGGFTTYQNASFNNCTFNLAGYIWTWGATEVNFTKCTFVGDSRTILAHGGANTVITITDCDFAATTKGYTGGGDWTAVVEIDPTGSNTYTINFEGENTLSENYPGWTRIKDGSTGHVVNGVN